MVGGLMSKSCGHDKVGAVSAVPIDATTLSMSKSCGHDKVGAAAHSSGGNAVADDLFLFGVVQTPQVAQGGGLCGVPGVVPVPFRNDYGASAV